MSGLVRGAAGGAGGNPDYAAIDAGAQMALALQDQDK
jgi:hypothetical protein